MIDQNQQYLCMYQLDIPEKIAEHNFISPTVAAQSRVDISETRNNILYHFHHPHFFLSFFMFYHLFSDYAHFDILYEIWLPVDTTTEEWKNLSITHSIERRSRLKHKVYSLDI